VLSANTAVEVCSRSRGHEVDFRSMPGTYIGNYTTGKVIYTPPDNKNTIISKLSNWENYIHNNDADPLIRMAVSHYQFEAIHPFSNGNGRTGRIMNILLLTHFRLLEHPILYLSKYILEHKSEYYKLLKNVTKSGDWENWILFMIKAVDVSSRNALSQISSINNLMHDYAKTIHDTRLLNLIFERPYCRIIDVQKTLGSSRPTATKTLKTLVEDKVLQMKKVGRDNLYINTELMNILQHYNQS
jgi:Fic family protein